MAAYGKNLNMSQKSVAGLYDTMLLFGEKAQLNTKKTML